MVDEHPGRQGQDDAPQGAPTHAMAGEGLAPRRIDDPRTLRALSHPLRLRLLAELGHTSPQNVTMLAQRVEEPANSVSYHLSQLLAHGLVERVDAPEGATRRERWFAAASRTGYSLVVEDESPERAASMAALRAWWLQLAGDSFDRMMGNEVEARRRGLPFGNASTRTWLTPEEAARVHDELMAVMRPLARRATEHRDDPTPPEGAVHYTVDVSYFPDFSDRASTGSFWNDALDVESPREE